MYVRCVDVQEEMLSLSFCYWCELVQCVMKRYVSKRNAGNNPEVVLVYACQTQRRIRFCAPKNGLNFIWYHQKSLVAPEGMCTYPRYKYVSNFNELFSQFFLLIHFPFFFVIVFSMCYAVVVRMAKWLVVGTSSLTNWRLYWWSLKVPGRAVERYNNHKMKWRTVDDERKIRLAWSIVVSSVLVFQAGRCGAKRREER